MFKPVYFNDKKSFTERASALRNETSAGKLKKAALDSNIDIRLRAIAIRQLKSPEVCETILMEYANGKSTDGPQKNFNEHFIASAETLASLDEQQRLERIFNTCVSNRVQAIVIANIENSELLEKAALNEGEIYGPWYMGVSENAVSAIRNEELLARIAIHGTSGHATEDAVKKISDSVLLQKVVTEASDISVRVNAVSRLDDASRIIPKLKEEFSQKIINAPIDSPWEIRLLASSKDATGRIMAYCTESYNTIKKDYNDVIENSEVLEADADIVYSFLKNLYKELSEKMDNKAWDYLPKVSGCIKLMHDSGIKKELIEKDFPKTLDYSCKVEECAGDDYDSAYSSNRKNSVSFW